MKQRNIFQMEEPHCIAVHSYLAENPEDLTFSEGARITLTQRLGADWLMGKLDGQSGIFPANFVKIIKDMEGTGVVGFVRFVGTGMLLLSLRQVVCQNKWNPAMNSFSEW